MTIHWLSTFYSLLVSDFVKIVEGHKGVGRNVYSCPLRVVLVLESDQLPRNWSVPGVFGARSKGEPIVVAAVGGFGDESPDLAGGLVDDDDAASHLQNERRA